VLVICEPRTCEPVFCEFTMRTDRAICWDLVNCEPENANDEGIDICVVLIIFEALYYRVFCFFLNFIIVDTNTEGLQLTRVL